MQKFEAFFRMILKDLKVESDDKFDRNFESRALTPPRAEVGYRLTQIMVREDTKLGEGARYLFTAIPD